MEPWEKYKFNGSEYKVWQIYKAYKNQAKKRGDFRNYLPIKEDPRESKNWKYFEQVLDNFSHDTLFDPFVFMEAQFRNLSKGETLFPAQLKTKTAVKKYIEHKDALRVVDVDSSSKVMMESLAATYRFLKRWWKNKGFEKDSYKEFFTRIDGEILSEGMLFCLQSMISKYFMAVSKHFNEEYNNLDLDMKLEIIPPRELKSYRIKIILNQDAFSFAKEIFNGEIS
jgi:hypothetical protein